MEIPEVDFSDKDIALGQFLSKLLGVFIYKGLMTREEIDQIVHESEKPIEFNK